MTGKSTVSTADTGQTTRDGLAGMPPAPSIVPGSPRRGEGLQMNDIPIISADSHAEEPYELFERLPRKYRERAPRIEEREDGVYVIQEGLRPIRQDLAAAKLS